MYLYIVEYSGPKGFILEASFMILSGAFSRISKCKIIRRGLFLLIPVYLYAIYSDTIGIHQYSLQKSAFINISLIIVFLSSYILVNRLIKKRIIHEV